MGPNITVSDPLTEKYMIARLHRDDQIRTGLLFREYLCVRDKNLFFDGMTTIEMTEFFKVPIRVAYSASDLYHLLIEWKDAVSVLIKI